LERWIGQWTEDHNDDDDDDDDGQQYNMNDPASLVFDVPRRRSMDGVGGGGGNGSDLSNISYTGESLLSRQYKTVMPLFVVAYVVAQCLISTQQSRCTVTPSPFSAYTGRVAVAFVALYAAAFVYYVLMACFVQSWTELELEHLRGVYCGAATVSLLAGTATAFYLVDGVGNDACVDVLGVYSPNAQWAEWLMTAPLLSYLSLAVEDKPSRLTLSDYAVMGSLFLCILFGFLMNFVATRTQGWTLFVFSALCMCGNVVKVNTSLFPRKKQKCDDDDGVGDGFGDGNGVAAPLWEHERALMRSKLARLLVVGFPAFPIIYLLSFSRIIDKDQLLIGYMVGGFILKGLFVAIISGESMVLQVAAERRIAESKRQFLRYLFHEVRVPLNTLTMGVSVLQQVRAGTLKPVDADAVLPMMETASDTMAAALNEVLSLSRAEDGAMRLELRVISVCKVVKAAVHAVSDAAKRKGATLVVEGLPQVTVGSGSERWALEEAQWRVRAVQIGGNNAQPIVCLSLTRRSIVDRYAATPNASKTCSCTFCTTPSSAPLRRRQFSSACPGPCL